MDRLRSFLNLERGEEAPALLLFAYLTVVMTSYMITKAVRDGLFLYKFSAYSLPYVYLGIAAIIGFVVWVYVQFSARVGQAAVISGSLVFLVGNLLLQWWVVRMQWAPATWIFYVWTSIFGIIIVTQVWTVANHVLDLRQAKRLFPLISSGGILGSALGGGIAARLAKLPSVGTDNLMAAAIGSLLALAQGDRLTKAAVAEYLDNVLPGKVKGIVLAVIEGKVRPSIQTVRQILEACLRNPDPILRECAAAAIGKDRWPESGLKPPLIWLKKGLDYG